jgi:hypothetical protein
MSGALNSQPAALPASQSGGLQRQMEEQALKMREDMVAIERLMSELGNDIRRTKEEIQKTKDAAERSTLQTKYDGQHKDFRLLGMELQVKAYTLKAHLGRLAVEYEKSFHDAQDGLWTQQRARCDALFAELEAERAERRQHRTKIDKVITESTQIPIRLAESHLEKHKRLLQRDPAFAIEDGKLEATLASLAGFRDYYIKAGTGSGSSQTDSNVSNRTSDTEDEKKTRVQQDKLSKLLEILTDVRELFVDYSDNHTRWSAEDRVEEHEALTWMLNETYRRADEVLNLEEPWAVEKKREMWKTCDKDGEAANLEEIIVAMKDLML